MPGTAHPIPGNPHGIVAGMPTTGVLPDEEIAQLALGAGVPSANVPTAVAIALAESGGRVEAINHNSNGTDDHGLWQINDVNLPKLHMTAQSVLAPENNAQAMSTLSSSGTNWSPWSTYNNKKYLLYMPRGKKAAATASTTPAQSALHDAVNGLTAPFTDIAKAISFLFSFQFLYVLGGGLLLIVAFILIAKQSGAAGHAANAAKTAAKLGAE